MKSGMSTLGSVVCGSNALTGKTSLSAGGGPGANLSRRTTRPDAR